MSRRGGRPFASNKHMMEEHTMDIKAKIEEIVNKAKSDKDFAAKLQ